MRGSRTTGREVVPVRPPSVRSADGSRSVRNRRVRGSHRSNWRSIFVQTLRPEAASHQGQRGALDPHLDGTRRPRPDIPRSSSATASSTAPSPSDADEQATTKPSASSPPPTRSPQCRGRDFADVHRAGPPTGISMRRPPRAPSARPAASGDVDRFVTMAGRARHQAEHADGLSGGHPQAPLARCRRRSIPPDPSPLPSSSSCTVYATAPPAGTTADTSPPGVSPASSTATITPPPRARVPRVDQPQRAHLVAVAARD